MVITIPTLRAGSRLSGIVYRSEFAWKTGNSWRYALSNTSCPQTKSVEWKTNDFSSVPVHHGDVRVDDPDVVAQSLELLDGARRAVAGAHVAEFRPGQNWKWIGKGRVGPTVAFDHQFEAVGEHRTKLDFVVETGGFLDAVFGR